MRSFAWHLRRIVTAILRIVYTVLTLIWVIFIICIILVVLWFGSNWFEAMKDGPIEAPMYGDHGLGPF